jgi:hypothetical protein
MVCRSDHGISGKTPLRKLLMGTNLLRETQTLMDPHPPIQSLKGNVYPITCHEGTEEEKRYSFTLSVISALEGVWSTPLFGLITPE